MRIAPDIVLTRSARTLPGMSFRALIVAVDFLLYPPQRVRACTRPWIGHAGGRSPGPVTESERPTHMRRKPMRAFGLLTAVACFALAVGASAGSEPDAIKSVTAAGGKIT